MPATTKKQVAANLTAEEHAAATKMAEKAKMTLGNFIRVKAFGLEPLKQGRPKA